MVVGRITLDAIRKANYNKKLASKSLYKHCMPIEGSLSHSLSRTTRRGGLGKLLFQEGFYFGKNKFSTLGFQLLVVTKLESQTKPI